MSKQVLGVIRDIRRAQNKAWQAHTFENPKAVSNDDLHVLASAAAAARAESITERWARVKLASGKKPNPVKSFTAFWLASKKHGVKNLDQLDDSERLKLAEKLGGDYTDVTVKLILKNHGLKEE